jgi:hypothetical protein
VSANDSFGFAGGSSSLHDEIPKPTARITAMVTMKAVYFFMTVLIYINLKIFLSIEQYH